MEFKYHLFVGWSEYEAMNSMLTSRAMSALFAGVEKWKEMHRIEYYGSANYVVDPLVEGSRFLYHLGVVLCEHGDVSNGTVILLDACLLIDQTLAGNVDCMMNKSFIDFIYDILCIDLKQHSLVTTDRLTDELQYAAKCWGNFGIYKSTIGEDNKVIYALKKAVKYFQILTARRLALDTSLEHIYNNVERLLDMNSNNISHASNSTSSSKNSNRSKKMFKRKRTESV
jgi:hypothetical protein